MTTPSASGRESNVSQTWYCGGGSQVEAFQVEKETAVFLTIRGLYGVHRRQKSRSDFKVRSEAVAFVHERLRSELARAKVELRRAENELHSFRQKEGLACAMSVDKPTAKERVLAKYPAARQWVYRGQYRIVVAAHRVGRVHLSDCFWTSSEAWQDAARRSDERG